MPGLFAIEMEVCIGMYKKFNAMLAKAVDQQLDRIQIQGENGSHEFFNYAAGGQELLPVGGGTVCCG